MRVVSLVSDLVAAYRATLIYPVGHPARNQFLDPLIDNINSYTAEAGDWDLYINQEAVEFNGEAIVTGNHAELLLSRECAERQLDRIHFGTRIQKRDIDAFFSMILEDAELVLDEGGGTQYMRTRGSGALKVGQAGEEVAIESPSSADTPHSVFPAFDIDGIEEISQEEELKLKLENLETAEGAPAYELAMKDVLQCLSGQEYMAASEDTLMVVKYLGARLTTGEEGDRASVIRKAVSDLASPEVVEALAGEITHREDEHREAVQAVLEEVGDLSIPILLRRMAVEEETFGRKALLTSLSGFGVSVRPHLERWLKDERWYVVRNALGLLMQVGGRKDSDRVKVYLSHPHAKVRFEALRFLSRYPTSLPESTIQNLLDDPDPDVQARTIYSLAILKGRQGYNYLVSMAKKPLAGQGDLARREMAIKGIGRGGGREAIDFLTNTMTRKPVLGVDGFSRIQIAVVEALIDIGGPSAVDALKSSMDSLAGTARRTAEEYVRRWESMEKKV
jgi:HEAT repeat protein